MNMGDRIKELRLRNEMTQEELGEKVGVKKAVVNKWESGMTVNLKRTTIKALSEIFDVAPSYLMGIKEDEDSAEDIYNKIRDYLDNFNELDYDDRNWYLMQIIKECTWNGKDLVVTV